MILNRAKSHIERLDPFSFVFGGESGYFGNASHLQRYHFAASLVAKRAVIVDAACGTGYGSKILASYAEVVYGIDIASEAISYARIHYCCPNVRNDQGDVTDLHMFVNASIDVFVSFETLEHLEDPDGLVREASRVLRADGIFIVSTPFRVTTCRSPGNPFHRIELGRHDFKAFLAKYFNDVAMYFQYRQESIAISLIRRLDLLNLRRIFRQHRGTRYMPTTAIEMSIDYK
jgi:2-polyprenyl-3-methyl-5-hydroxy-6-metoxy-1,4-benzoquinol methylase